MANKSSPATDESYFNSFDCVDVFVDKPGDTTVRPIPPDQLERARALRDGIQAALAAGTDLAEQEVYIDKLGDTTVRPCDPRFLEHAKTERAKIMAAQAANGEQGDDAHAEKPLS